MQASIHNIHTIDMYNAYYCNLMQNYMQNNNYNIKSNKQYIVYAQLKNCVVKYKINRHKQKLKQNALCAFFFCLYNQYNKTIASNKKKKQIIITSKTTTKKKKKTNICFVDNKDCCFFVFSSLLFSFLSSQQTTFFFFILFLFLFLRCIWFIRPCNNIRFNNW